MFTNVMPAMFHALRSKPGSGWQTLLLAAALFAAALAALLVQSPHGQPILWLSNALFIGLLLRNPESPPPTVWPAAGAALILASLSWGVTPLHALSYCLVNLAGAWVAWRLLSGSKALENLRRPRAIVHLLFTGAVAAAVHAGCATVLVPWLHPATSKMSLLTGWFLTQWLSYCVFLPPILLLPRLDRRQRRHVPTSTSAQLSLEKLAPFGALLLSLVLCFLVGGPSILIFPIPPLLYAALSYRQHTTAWLVLLTAVIITFGTTHGLIPLGILLQRDLVSLQLGVLLLAMTPLLMSSVLAARSDTISALNLALDHDVLTGALSRQAFLHRIQECLHNPAAPRGTGLLMLDLDQFKRLNDTYGHAAGDRTLRAFARTVQSVLRPEDLFGRLGGEEFGIGLSDTAPEEVAAIAERLRANVADSEIHCAENIAPIHITVSIGVIHSSQVPGATLQSLLSYADQAMYRAKRSGRNRVCFHDATADAFRAWPATEGTHVSSPDEDVVRSHSIH